MMPPEYQEYYRQLLAAIDAHQGVARPEMEMIEACFKSSLDHWGRVYRQVRQQGFGTSAEEIGFFKAVKPGFTAWIEYYTYRYHVLLFRPSGNALEVQRFWKWERRKMERFYESNEEFCRYMKEGATNRDEEYFLRTSCAPSGGRNCAPLMYDLDSEMSSSMDHLATMIKAYELYEKYIQLNIQTCHLEA
jgi:RteC protein